MPEHRFPSRVVSETFTVNVTGLPAWLPDRGLWAQVSLDTMASKKGDHPNFPSSRNLDALASDFTGVVFNPYMGAHGAYLLHGGGHQQYLGNEVYAWSADTRQWSRLTVPTYPGTNSVGTSLVTLGDWTAFKEPPFASDYLNTYGELALGVPASNHSRWHPCILPPSLGGGAQGSMLIPYQSATHTSGNGTFPQAHRFDCATSTWSRLGNLNTVIGSGVQCWASAVDTTRGDVWTFGQYSISKMVGATGTPVSVSVTGYNGTDFARTATVYVPSVDCFVIFDPAMTLRVVNPAGGALVAPTVSGTPPGASAGQSNNGVYCQHLGANGSIVSMDFTNKVVKALAVPSNPYTGTWTWTTLSASNTPSYGDAQWWYHRLQYAPALKAFFVATLAEGTLNAGGMWCFRPSEIP